MKISGYILEVIGVFLLTILIVGLVALIPAAVLYGLWNWLGPEVFKGPTITFLQSYGLVFLFMLIGSFFRGSSK